MLLVMYAKEVDRWEQNIVEVQQEFVKNAEETLLTFEVADLKRIIGQVEGSDIIYIHGGDTELLVSTLDVTMDWTDMFKGKVVAGDSAGGNFLSKIGYSPKKDSFLVEVEPCLWFLYRILCLAMSITCRPTLTWKCLGYKSTNMWSLYIKAGFDTRAGWG